MHILFIHQNFPGQFKLLAEALAQRSEYQVFGLGDTIRLKARKLNFSFSVSGYTARESPKSQAHHYLESFERAIRRGQDVVRACQKMKAQGLAAVDQAAGDAVGLAHFERPSARATSRANSTCKISCVTVLRVTTSHERSPCS